MTLGSASRIAAQPGPRAGERDGEADHNEQRPERETESYDARAGTDGERGEGRCRVRPGSRPIGHPSPFRPVFLDLDQRMAEATALAAPNPSSMTVPAGS